MVLEKHLSVRAAAETFGYNEQYLRRLLRSGQLQGVKIGQVWLIRLASLEAHLSRGYAAQDRRFGPQGIVTESERGVAS
jgi:excisionase family DNA binding protein